MTTPSLRSPPWPRLALMGQQYDYLASTEVVLAWPDSGDDGRGFVIERSLDGGPYGELATVGPSVSEYLTPAPPEGVSYSYQVYAYNATGVSAATQPTQPTTTPNGASIVIAFYGAGPKGSAAFGNYWFEWIAREHTTMKTSNVICWACAMCWCLSTVRSLPAVATEPSGIERDFTNARDELTSHPSSYSLLAVRKAAEPIARKYGGAAIPFFAEHVKDPHSQTLALMCLALLAEDQHAIDALRNASAGDVLPEYRFMIMLSYAPRDVVRREGEALMQSLFKSGRPHCAEMLIELMGAVGDEGTIKLMRTIVQDRRELHEDTKKGLLHYAEQLEQYLAMDPGKRAQRLNHELIFLQTSRDLRGFQNIASDYPDAAERLAAGGVKLPADFLFAKIREPGFDYAGRFSDRYPTAALMAMAVLGQQKEAAAVSEIARFATGQHIFGEVAVGALHQIGTPEALRILNSLPTGDNP